MFSLTLSPLAIRLFYLAGWNDVVWCAGASVSSSRAKSIMASVNTNISASVMGSLTSTLAMVVPFLDTVSNFIAPIARPTNMVIIAASISGHARAATSSSTAIPNIMGMAISSAKMMRSAMSRGSSSTLNPQYLACWCCRPRYV